MGLRRGLAPTSREQFPVPPFWRGTWRLLVMAIRIWRGLQTATRRWLASSRVVARASHCGGKSAFGRASKDDETRSPKESGVSQLSLGEAAYAYAFWHKIVPAEL